MFKVNNKDSKISSSVSIVNFEHVIPDREQTCIPVSVINPFQATGVFLCPLKKSESPWFSDVFRGYI